MFLLCISAEPDASFPCHFPLRGRKRDKSCEGRPLGGGSQDDQSPHRRAVSTPQPGCAAWLKESSPLPRVTE